MKTLVALVLLGMNSNLLSCVPIEFLNEESVLCGFALGVRVFGSSDEKFVLHGKADVERNG